jgi:hypothetical protein
MNTSVSLELMMFPFIQEADLAFGELPSKSVTRISPLIHGVLEDKFDSGVFSKFIMRIWENFEEEITNTRLENFKAVFLEDQVGRVNFLSTFLCPVDLNILKRGNSRKRKAQDKKNKEQQVMTEEDLVELSNEFEIFQFVNCLQYQTDLTKKLLLSPEFLLSQNKGDVSDHAILLACLFMGLK